MLRLVVVKKEVQPELLVKKLAFSVYDIFWGTGWEQWERVKVIPKHAAIIHLKGQKHPSNFDRELLAQV
jgi:hypothetical protein